MAGRPQRQASQSKGATGNVAPNLRAMLRQLGDQPIGSMKADGSPLTGNMAADLVEQLLQPKGMGPAPGLPNMQAAAPRKKKAKRK